MKSYINKFYFYFCSTIRSPACACQLYSTVVMLCLFCDLLSNDREWLVKSKAGCWNIASHKVTKVDNQSSHTMPSGSVV